ncbi:MAG: SCO family protein [Chloroflexi bacterium]|nr:MAG: SCO family protein [Chloroflexota bacterium]
MRQPNRPDGSFRGILFLILAVGLLIAACKPSAPSFRGTAIEPPRPAADFVLTDQDGRPFRLSDQRGHVVLLFFGYTHCPDVCPATLTTWKQVHEALGDDADRVRFVFITVDPERDTPERLKEHVTLFGPDFLGLTGPPEALEAVYKAFGVYREKVTTEESALGYLMNHTARTYLLDQEGRWVLSYAFGTPAEDIVHDIRQLLR